MIDRSQLWIGTINDALTPDPSVRRRVGLYDTTLRDGEQTVGVALGAEAKLEIARALDQLGVERIEAGFPRVSEEDERAYRLILDADLKAEIWGFSRAIRADVEVLAELEVRASVVESPISDHKISAYGLTREKVESRTLAAIEFARSAGIRVCYFGVDGTRADREFMEHMYRAAVQAGAEEIALVDTQGVATPEAVADLVEAGRSWVGDEIPIHWHGHNDFGLATAGAIAAARAGAMWVHGTINGMGERAGNTDLAEFALAVEALYHAETGFQFEHVVEVAHRVQALCRYDMPPWKPLTGENLFVRESGGVVAQFHQPDAIEPYSSRLVGAHRGIVLGKKSGLASIAIKLRELGIDVPEEQHPVLLAAVKKRGQETGRLVDDGAFLELATGIGGSPHV